MNGKTLGVIGMLATIGGAALSVVSSIVGKKQQDNTIKAEVTKAVAELTSKKES